MSLPLEFRLEARREFDDAFDWYEAQRTGLGRRFAAEVENALAAAAKPLRHRLAYLDVRKAPVKRFPYSVFFRVLPRALEIVAVYHAKRNPAAWKGRV